MKGLTYRLVAVTDAAGKYKPGAARDGNEDLMYVDLDLAGEANASTVPDSFNSPGSLGMLMVVADGMGGMNAGEVASQIAIDTVKEEFQKEKLSEIDIESPEARAAYMEGVIARANDNIQNDANLNPARSGMGSTLIMAWLMPNGELTVSWIGDSRAYVYNRKGGLHLLSEDHSFVQQLVNKGIITYEQSFDHPQNNVVMKSLGDPSQPCEPESRQYHVGKGDIIMLCSDGLSGVLRDKPGKNPESKKPYPEENLQDYFNQFHGSMKELQTALWRAAEAGGWYDNVTAIFCSIVEGPASKVVPEVTKLEKAQAEEIKRARIAQGFDDNAGKSGKSKKWIYIVVLLILIIATAASFFILRQKENEKSAKANIEQKGGPVVSSEETKNIPAKSATKETVTPKQDGAPAAAPKITPPSEKSGSTKTPAQTKQNDEKEVKAERPIKELTPQEEERKNGVSQKHFGDPKERKAVINS